MRLVPLVPRADWQNIPDGLVDALTDAARRARDWKKGQTKQAFFVLILG